MSSQLMTTKVEVRVATAIMEAITTNITAAVIITTTS